MANTIILKIVCGKRFEKVGKKVPKEPGFEIVKVRDSMRL